MSRDPDKEIVAVSHIAPAALKTTTTTPTGVDLAGFMTAVVIIHPGVITDGTHTPELQESDTLGSGYTTVAAADMSGTPAALASSTVQEIGYLGNKRYLRLVITVTGSPSTGGYYTVTILKGQPRTSPQ